MKTFNKIKYIGALLLIIVLSFWACDNSTDSVSSLQTISGKIKSTSGKFIGGAVIEAYGAANNLIDRDTTDDEGNFELMNIPETFASVTIKVQADGHDPFNSSLSDISGDDKQTENLLITLVDSRAEDDDCCSVVEINVSNREKEKVGNANVRIGLEDVIIAEGNTNDNGYIRFDSLCSANYWIRIAKDGYKVIETQFELGKCDTVAKDFTLSSNEYKDSCCDGKIYIITKDSRTGEKINRAKIILWQDGKELETKYTENGMVLFTDLCEGNYWVDIMAEGYKHIEFAIELGCNKEKEIVKELVRTSEKDSCCDGKIYIIIKDSRTGEKINRAKIILWQDGKELETKYTENGMVLFTDLCEGKYGVDIMAEGYKHIEFATELGCNKEKEIVKELVRTSEKDSCCDGKIYILAKDSRTGEKINNAKVVLWHDGKELETKYTENGMVLFTDLCEGKYGVDIMAEGYKHIEFAIELGCNKEKEIVKELVRTSEKDSCCDGKIYILAKDSRTGEKINNAKVVLWHDGKELETKYTENGMVLFTDLCEGKYGVDIMAEGYKHIEFAIELGCNKEKEIVKELVRTSEKDSCCDGKIYIVPKDAETKTVIKGAEVKLWHSGNVIADAVCGESYALFEDVCEGSYVVEIIAEGYQDVEFEVRIGCNEVIDPVKLMEKSNGEPCDDAILKLIIKDAESSRALGGVKVIIYSGERIIEDLISNNDGVVIFDGLTAPAVYRVVLEYDGYQAKTVEFRFEKCITLKETIRMEKN